MAAVTQMTPNFLGGVSRQTDDKKLDGQVVDIINGYPDPTYGLVKRGSTGYLWTLKRPFSERPFTEDELEDAFWFYCETKTTVTEENQSKYPFRKIGDVFPHPFIACIHKGQPYVWDSLSGESQPVFSSGPAYLQRPDGSYYGSDAFHARTILDTTIICNRNKVTEMVPNTSTFIPGKVGTIRLNEVLPETDYVFLINDVVYEFTSATEASAANILAGIAELVPDEFNPTIYETSVELSSNNQFTLSVRDKAREEYLNSYQDVVRNQTLLAADTVEGRLVEVIGDKAIATDNFFLRFVDGFWTETTDPQVATEFNATTMPHRLYINPTGQWQFGPIVYEDRLVGDDESNPIPSFIGKTINSSFYYNNRLGFLSESNVVMSQAKDVYNFFAKSQLAITDADPIDVNANSTRPVDLYEVVPQPQGVLLFGTRQQFWMSAPETGVLTPSSTTIKAIASFESDKYISPLDIGTQIGFVSKTPDYSKLMIMQGQGEEIDPTVVEISKVVTGWLPNDINRMAVSPQSSTILLTGNDSEYVYLYRFYNDGQEDRMQAWAKWEMPGKVQALNVANDMVFIITMQGDRYVTTWLSLNSLDKSGPQFSDDPFKPGAPYLDFMSAPSTVVYDGDVSRIYPKFPSIPGRNPIMVLTLPFGSDAPMVTSRIGLIENMRQLPRVDNQDDPGYWMELPEITDPGNGGTPYYEIEGDWSGHTNSMTLGYSYDFEVTLPKFYYKNPAKSGASDYTAHLNINRVKFAVGQSGAVTFKTKAYGSDEWVDIQHVTDADYYEADTDPIAAEQTFTVPIHQRNKNFQLKVTSDLPFPVSLVSMMWEGQYNPRFYRRA